MAEATLVTFPQLVMVGLIAGSPSPCPRPIGPSSTGLPRSRHFDARTPVSPFMMVCWYCGRSSHLPFHRAGGLPGVLLFRHFVTAGVISVSTHRSQFGRASEAFTCPRSGLDACWPRHLCPGTAWHRLPDPLGAPHNLDHSGRCQGPAHIFCGVLLDSPQGYSMESDRLFRLSLRASALPS